MPLEDHHVIVNLQEQINALNARIDELANIVSTYTEEGKIPDTRELEKATTTVTQYMMALRSCLSLAKRMGLPEETEQAITAIQKLIRIAYQLKIAIHAVEAAMSTTTAGLVIRAGVAIAGLIVTSMDVGA